MRIPSRTYQDKLYRFTFQGQEKDDEIKGEGNSYDFGARMHAPRVGRFLTVDPLAAKYPSIGPYTFVNDSPIIFLDPDGEKIKFAKNLTKAEKKTYKAELKCLKSNSQTFRSIYKVMKRTEDVYTYGKTTEIDGDAYDPETKVIAVNFNGNSNNFDLTTVIAHESGHAYRDLKGLDPQKSDNPYEPGTPENFAFDKNLELYQEYEATHIENVIRSELGYELRETYGEKTSYNADNTITLLKKKRIDLSKGLTLEVKKNSSFDYGNLSKKPIEEINQRKIEAKDIKVHGYQNEKDFQ